MEWKEFVRRAWDEFLPDLETIKRLAQVVKEEFPDDFYVDAKAGAEEYCKAFAALAERLCVVTRDVKALDSLCVRMQTVGGKAADGFMLNVLTKQFSQLSPETRLVLCSWIGEMEEDEEMEEEVDYLWEELDQSVRPMDDEEQEQ